MELRLVITRFVFVNFLTVFYSLLTLLIISLSYVKDLIFSTPLKRKLEPPACLTDPKYGVHKYIKVNNIKLHYVESGDPTKPLLIMLHGFPEFWYSWRHQIVEFKKDYWCIAVDLRGYGDSERPEGVDEYHITVLIEDIRDLIHQLGREKCILLTHDWGGIVGCKLRDVYPQLLSCLVMLSSLTIEAWDKRIRTDIKQLRKSWYVFMFRAPYLAEHMMSLNNLAMFDKSMLVPGKDTVTAEDIECYKYWFGKQFAFTPPVNYYRANVMYNVPNKLRTGGVPMLVVHAEKDLYVETKIQEILKEEYDDIECKVIQNCGHFMQQEEPEKVNKIVRDFLEKNNLY
ncbi:unnamed protein product [Chilo suppressalis]|uniref:AB hydrolase-1 domain-containing protein n=1 Tax=Chilo suppressalis TaxID=168631 RepID=A0ABN8AQ37_CHISP|nr:unnamed protein product [Chilo suppressalis]